MTLVVRKTEEIDFEELGYKTMVETGDEMVARDICGLQIHAVADELSPKLSRLSSAIRELKGRRQALWAHLYDRHEPVSDAAMLGLTIAAGILIVMIVVAAIASVCGHAMTFYLFGSGFTISLVLGLALTGIATASGYQAFEKILARYPVAERVVILAAFALCFWGLFQMAQARGTMVEKLANSTSAKSFVDDNATEADSAEPSQASASEEQKMRSFLGSAMVKIMLSADIILGVLLGLFVRIRTNEDFAAWQELKKTAQDLGSLEERSNELLSSIEIAKKRCMAGILRAKYMKRKRCVPYHQVLPILLLIVLCLAASPIFAQTITRHEGILIDVSGSIGKGGANEQLFREYLLSVKKLLRTEPPNSRIWVSVITTESFGSVRTLLKGWTPDAQGVFTDDLDHARHQLVVGFKTKSAGLSPTAAGTDIIGGLWQLKTSLESGSKGTSDISKTIWIFSDMMNESASFNMPALLATGPKQMIDRAKSDGLIVPLSGYRVYVVGASPARLSPQTWYALRSFWMQYFRVAGAEVMSYSAECRSERD